MKKIIGLLTSATIAFTTLGGVFSDVLGEINLLSLPIVAEAVNESTAVTLNDNTYADSSAQGIKIESAEVPLGTEEVTLGVSLMNISKSVGCVVTAKCPVELGEPRISGEIAGKDIYIKNEDYLVQALCINCDGLSSEFLFITFDIPQDTVTCTTYDIDIEVEQLDNDGSFIDNPVAIDGTIEIYEPINIITQPIEEATDEPEVTTVIDNSNSGIKLESKDVPLGIKEVTLAVSLINISNSIGCIVTAKSPLVLGEPKISGAIKIKNVSVTEEQYSSSALCIATTGLSSEFMYITFNIPVNAIPGTVYDIYVEVEQLDNNGFLLENAITVDGKITIVNEFKGLEYQTIDTDNNGTHDAVEIYDCNSNVASIEIPAEINGLPVKRIAERAFYACSDLEKIIIPEGLVVIDDDAFRDCTSLTSVNIPSTVTTINRGAFFGCNKLKSITIPETVTYISSFWNQNGDIYETLNSFTIGYASNEQVIQGFVIYGVAGTEAEKYALEHGIIFVDINNLPYITKTELTLTAGESYVLDVKNFNGKIVWDTNDNSIAIVKEGYVTAVSEGETIVYAIIGDKVLKCDVIVTEKEAVTTSAVTTTYVTTSTAVTTSTEVATSTDASVTTTKKVTIENVTTPSSDKTFDIRENNGTIIIINYNDTASDVVIPVRIDGKIVSKISDYALLSDIITSVTFDNPTCEIFDSATTINESAIIYGFWESTAHDYAIKYNREFVSLNGEPDYVQGDITGDGNINLYDAIEICKYIMGMKTLTEEEEAMADFDGNDVVDLYDAIGIAKKLLE